MQCTFPAEAALAAVKTFWHPHTATLRTSGAIAHIDMPYETSGRELKGTARLLGAMGIPCVIHDNTGEGIVSVPWTMNPYHLLGVDDDLQADLSKEAVGHAFW